MTETLGETGMLEGPRPQGKAPELLLLAAITAVGLLLRLVALDAESLWADEWFSLSMTTYRVSDLLGGQYPDAHPPGYYLLLKGWVHFFGRTAEAARALSAATALLLVPATWMLAREAGLGPRARLFAAVLVAASPPLVYLGREVRSYAMVAAISTLTAWATLRTERKPATGAWVTFVATGAAGLYVHYYGFLVLGACGLFLLWRRWRLGLAGLAPLAIATVAIALAFAPWVPSFLSQYRHGYGSRTESWLQHLAFFPAYLLVGHTLAWKAQAIYLMAVVWAVAVGAVLLPAAWATLRAPTRARVPALLGTLVFVEAVAISLLRKPIVNGRYLSVVFPCLLVGIVVGLVELARLRPRLARVATTALLVLFAASLVRLYAVRHKDDWRTPARHVAETGPRLPVFSFRAHGLGPMSWYSPGTSYQRINAKQDGPSARWTPDDPQGLLVKTPELWYVSPPWTEPPGTGSREADLDAWLAERFERVDRRDSPLAVLSRWKQRPPRDGR